MFVLSWGKTTMQQLFQKIKTQDITDKHVAGQLVKHKIELLFLIIHRKAYENEHKLFYHIVYEINEKQLNPTNK